MMMKCGISQIHELIGHTQDKKKGWKEQVHSPSQEAREEASRRMPAAKEENQREAP